MSTKELLTKIKEFAAKDSLPKSSHKDAYALLDDFTFALEKNFDALQSDKVLRQQFIDCCTQLSKSPLINLDKSFEVDCGSYFIALIHWLNNDIEKLCQSVTEFLREEKAILADMPIKGFLLNRVGFRFYRTLSAADWEKYRLRMVKSFEEIYPESGMAIYLKSMDDTLTDEQRMDYCSEVIALNPVFYPALLDIAGIFYREKNWKSAIAYYRKTIDSLEEFTGPGVYFNIAWCYGKVRDNKNEAEFYEKCLAGNPKQKFAMNNLGYAYQKSKNFEKALECFEKSMKSGLDGKYPFRNYFHLLKRLRRYKEAEEFLKENKKHFPRAYENELKKLHEEEASRPAASPAEPPEEEDFDIGAEQEDAMPEPVSEPKRGGKTGKSAFTSEARLEAEIVERLNQGLGFDNLPLKIYDTPDNYGQQFIIPGIGRIDILAVHAETNDFYVIELKKGLGDDEVMGQISRYMGWVKHNLAKDGQNVHGIICTGQVSDKLKYAAMAVPNVRLCSYSFSFSQVT